MSKLTHVRVDIIPQPMNGNFDVNMDEAVRQVRIANAAPALLDALKTLLAHFEFGVIADEHVMAAHAAIKQAEG